MFQPRKFLAMAVMWTTSFLLMVYYTVVPEQDACGTWALYVALGASVITVWYMIVNERLRSEHLAAVFTEAARQAGKIDRIR